MAINTSYGIGNSAAFVGSILSGLIGRMCGSVYRYNDLNRNKALLYNGVKETKYPKMGTMIWERNIGEYAYPYDKELNRPVMSEFSTNTLYDYVHNNDYFNGIHPEVNYRLSEALRFAKSSMMINNAIIELNPIEEGGDFDKLNDNNIYSEGEYMPLVTTDGGNLKGRLSQLLTDIVDKDTQDIAGWTNFSNDNYLYDIHSFSSNPKIEGVRKTLLTYGAFGVQDKIEFYSVNDTVSGNEPIVINPTLGKYALQGKYDGVTETLDRLSNVYINGEKDGYHNIPSELMDVLATILKTTMAGSPYVSNGTGHDIKGEVQYGVDSSEWKSGFPTGNSVDGKGFVRDDGETAYSDYSNRGHSKTHLLYDEKTYGDSHILSIGGSDNDGNLSEGFVPMDLGDSSMDSSSLLLKTNNLFRQGKIGSLINRFHTKKVSTDELTSAVDSLYGMSRGRNLRKDSVTDHYGYDNPYCRVWTSVHQYSKYTNLIRPFSTDSGLMTPEETRSNLGGFNSNHNLNLNEYGALQPEIGIPRIAPKNPDDVKRCMFSIENLAWKDVNFNAFVNHTNRTTLSKEQQGPNGGRIMWFPPYNLKFTENVGVQWNPNSFIGRGEQIYTYTNTERSGTLNFTLLVDHPSVVDKWSRPITNATHEHEHELLKFFAGCDILEPEEKATISPAYKTETKRTWISTTPAPSPQEGQGEDRYYIFFPNDFSGIDFIGSDVKIAMKYLNSGNEGQGYEMYNNDGVDGCISAATHVCKDKNGKMTTWYYQPDKRCEKEVLKVGAGLDNYKDTKSYHLNTHTSKGSDGVPTIRQIAYSGTTAQETQSALLKKLFSLEGFPAENVFSFVDLSGVAQLYAGMFGTIRDSEGNVVEAPADADYDVSIEVRGYASSHGYVASNTTLADDRAKVIAAYLKTFGIFPEDSIRVTESRPFQLTAGNYDINSFEAKATRSVEVIVKYVLKNSTIPPVNATEDLTNVVVENRSGQTGYYKTETNVVKLDDVVTLNDIDSYDNEYLYFNTLDKDSPLIRKNIVEKVRFFDPAFHSITPEGFNGRLAFLHQCTRQGPTSSASDSGKTAMGAGNLAFGRPPVCVLRIGDFYNTKIIIDSISIDYDNGGGTQWDMNPEGIGLQPMMANVSISFKFLGGSDITGPIARLQNAVSDNFYANESVYNDRADYRQSYISANNDEAMAWSPNVITNSDETGENFANHSKFSTIKNR